MAQRRPAFLGRERLVYWARGGRARRREGVHLTRRALICSDYLPQGDLDSSSRRLLHFVDFLQGAGWEVTAAAKKLARIDRAGRTLRQRGVASYSVTTPEFKEVVADQRFDVAILAFWHIAEPIVNLLRRHSPTTRVVVDSMDLHFVRHARCIFSSAVSDRSTRLLGEQYADETIRELNVYAAADLVLVVSEKEAKLVNDLVGDDTLARQVPDCEDLPRSTVPFEARRGIVFIGSFEHPPNVDAARYLCDEIIPQLDADLLAEHPVFIVGNRLGPELHEYMRGVPGVRVVGWVPSLVPYIERVRVSAVPLLYGAGTKRKIIQTLMIGTPAVTTQIGAEGLAIEDGTHVLLAEEPQAFAASLAQLLRDEELWQRIAAKGREHVLSLHSCDLARGRLLAAVEAALERTPKGLLLADSANASQRETLGRDRYAVLVRRIRRLVRQTLPAGATVAVISRGDPDLLALDGRTAWHFPQDSSGEYAGFHPRESADAVAHLEALRTKGTEFLLLPSTALWWLDHYEEFRRYLETRFSTLVRDDEICAIFDLREESDEAAAETLDGGEAEGSPTGPVSRPGNGFERRLAETAVGPSPLRISVVVPTLNRAALLESTLVTLAEQTLVAHEYEVIVVDDGSTDATGDVCRRLSERMQLRYERIDRAGIAVAKNVGALAAAGPIVLFFDDDDLADRDLLRQHVLAHEEHPEETIAVLGYTAWAPALDVTEVMHFVTDVGHYLFSYDDLADGDRLDFTYFWGGRTSCKRSLLAKHGLFRPEFTFGSEDIELAYRLSKLGFEVVFRRAAQQYMNRPISYDEFCRRCERQGNSQWMFSRMYADGVVQRYCMVEGAEERWRELEPLLDEKVARVHELERKLRGYEGPERERAVKELWGLYWWSFNAFKIKGIVEAMRSERHDRGEVVAGDVSSRGVRMHPTLRRAYSNDHIEVCPNPIFVIGAPRSGTTALGWALAEHSQMWTSAETLFLIPLFRDTAEQYKRWYERPVPTWLCLQGVDRAEFLGHLGLGLNALFTNRSGGRRWIDHTPDHAFMVETLLDMFPGAKFLHLLRDGRAVVSSMINVSKTLEEEKRLRMIERNFLPRWAFDFGEACRSWRASVEAAAAAEEKYADRVLSVPNEDLTSVPDEMFQKIFAFLDVPFEDGPSRYWRSTRANSSFRQGSPDEAPQINSGAERWKKWSIEERRFFVEHAGHTLVRYGFATEWELRRESRAD